MTLYFTAHTPLAISILAPTAILEWFGGAGAAPFRHTFCREMGPVQQMTGARLEWMGHPADGFKVSRGDTGFTLVDVFDMDVTGWEEECPNGVLRTLTKLQILLDREGNINMVNRTEGAPELLWSRALRRKGPEFFGDEVGEFVDFVLRKIHEENEMTQWGITRREHNARYATGNPIPRDDREVPYGC